jgi:iron complex transport system permease protein
MMNRGRLSWALAAAILVLFLASLDTGPAPVRFMTALADVWAGTGSGAAVILAEVRLPRALLGLMVGACLGLSGAVLQGWLRNPLAEPTMIGLSPCAALGAVVAFYGGWASRLPLALPLGGIAGAVLGIVLLQALAGRASGVLTLILAGTALSSLAGALTSLALSLSPNPYALAEIVFWLLGSLADRSIAHVAVAAPFMAAGLALLATVGRGLDGLTLGETTARSLGIDLDRLRLAVVAGTALAVGASVAVAGSIGFVGLIVPHLLRPLVGWEPSRLLLPSTLGGAALTLAADIAVRLSGTNGEMKLGVATALIGAPFFLFLVLKTRSVAA